MRIGIEGLLHQLTDKGADIAMVVREEFGTGDFFAIAQAISSNSSANTAAGSCAA